MLGVSARGNPHLAARHRRRVNASLNRALRKRPTRTIVCRIINSADAHAHDYWDVLRPQRPVALIRADVHMLALNAGLPVHVLPARTNRAVQPGIHAGRVRLDVQLTVGCRLELRVRADVGDSRAQAAVVRAVRIVEAVVPKHRGAACAVLADAPRVERDDVVRDRRRGVLAADTTRAVPRDGVVRDGRRGGVLAGDAAVAVPRDGVVRDGRRGVVAGDAIPVPRDGVVRD